MWTLTWHGCGHRPGAVPGAGATEKLGSVRAGH